MGPRARLNQLLTERLVPELKRRGFAGPEKISGNGLFHEFTRRKGDVNEMLDIQFEKSGLPRFLINLSLLPAAGGDAIVEQGGTVVAGRVTPQPGPYTRHWFRADRLWWERLMGKTDSREEDAVLEAVGMLEEIDRWWSSPLPSLHIRDASVKYPGRKRSNQEQ
jgi:hypothetical protein